jgi:acyl-CoA synthetase (AMP-forming)/AMP-acid ligase II
VNELADFDATILERVARQAARDAAAVAIAAPNCAPLGYGGLYRHLTGAAAALAEMGIGRTDRLAVALTNGPEMATAFLAASTAAVCVPLNPAAGAAEQDAYLKDVRATALLTAGGMPSPALDVARRRGLPVIELSPQREAGAGLFTVSGTKIPDGGGGGPPRGDDVALLLPTSGTTARPKIVPLQHAQLCASAAHIGRTLRLRPEDRCLNMMPLFHIHGLAAALLATLASGGSVMCTSGFDAETFFAWIDEFTPTWYTAVPTIHQSVLAAAGSHGDTIARRPLRFIRSSSSALPPAVMQALEETFHTPVIEAYGMTEAAHQICSNPLPPEARKAGSVGPAAGPEVAIMDEAGNVLPQGATGEVVIRGRSVICGYVNNPAANQAAFVAEWFRTGDLGRLDADGYLFLSGRIKELINRGGEKIAPREIDEALLDHPAVAQAVTFAVPHGRMGEDVAAAVVLRQGAVATPQMLREHVSARLAAHKVPSQVIVVDEVPKGPTGKPQRIGLHAKLAPRLTAEFVAPREGLETMLAGAWAELLGLPQVGANDNFFALGGDSLLAMQAVVRVRAALGVDLPVAALFREPTLAGLARTVGQAQAEMQFHDETSLLAEIESLSEEEARKMLTEEAPERLDGDGRA